MPLELNITKISKTDLLEHPYVQELHNVVHKLHSDIEALRIELRKLKKMPKKPVIKASKLDEEPPEEKDENPDSDTSEGKSKRPGSQKRSKTKKLIIHKEEIVKANSSDSHWRFQGYSDYIVQGIKIESYNICYKRESWKTPEGKYILAALPQELQGTHFSPELRSFILYQYNQCLVTQPLLLEQLREYGVDISSGQLSNILTERIDNFHKEVDEILLTGLELFLEIRTDDTSAPHKNKRAYCNCINTDYFTYFKSSDFKNRINFLEILSGGTPVYILDQAALSYLQEIGLSKKYFSLFEFSDNTSFSDKETWNNYLKDKEIVLDNKAHVYKKITEAALISGLISTGFNTDIVIHSDDAGQFKLFVNSLCWKHAERPLLKLICYTNYQREILNKKLSDFWRLYRDLKLYKLNQEIFKKEDLIERFDKICVPVTEGFEHLNPVLKKLASKKEELMLVIERPYTSLENNPSERDIREFAKRRKVNGPTKSEAGRKARDTFASLKKTCRKLEISFWEYLQDRVSEKNNIPNIAEIIAKKLSENMNSTRAG